MQSERGEIECVQPLCGRRTDDFYRIGPSLVAESDDVKHGPTCVHCAEKIIARATRGAPAPIGKQVSSDNAQ